MSALTSATGGVPFTVQLTGGAIGDTTAPAPSILVLGPTDTDWRELGTIWVPGGRACSRILIESDFPIAGTYQIRLRRNDVAAPDGAISTMTVL